MKKIFMLSTLSILIILGCSRRESPGQLFSRSLADAPFIWENANVYFLLTDRFNNGDLSNDVNFNRSKKTAKLRGFMGGDIRGVTQKIEEGYFDDLGITAIWLTPFIEQIHGSVDEGTGVTYGFHGYWASDWTTLDPNFGTEEDLATFVLTAHKHDIRVMMDVVVNHTGPVTEMDPVWPSAWVRTEPRCTYSGYKTTVPCTLVDNLPDIKTESNENVELPKQLTDKWKKEGRYQKEIEELDAFFARTGYPRAPRYYIIKWLVDYVKKYGIDGYRLDTAKHIEESIWADLGEEAGIAFREWKKANPGLVLDDNDFFMVGEVYNYGISGGRFFDFGDQKVDYFNYRIQGLINFEFKSDAEKPYDILFSKYDRILQNELAGQMVLNYISSHDDGGPFDGLRERTIEAGTKLLLCPGAAQVYYGDETGRSLVVEGTIGDATLRSLMNWDELKENKSINGVPAQEILLHWQKLGRFRKAHPAIGAGKYALITKNPHISSRKYTSENFSDAVVIGLDMSTGEKVLDVSSVFTDGAILKDCYSGREIIVKDGKATVESDYNIVLLALI